jgi:hypothetical protein
MAQWNQISGIAGVQVAAPIAMVGYTFMNAQFPVRLPAADVARPGRQLYRIDTTWVSANGATRIPEPASYVYVTPDRVRFSFAANGATFETLPDGKTVTACPAYSPPGNPLSPAARSVAWCWSKINGAGTPPGTLSNVDLQGHAGFSVSWQFPMLIAAIPGGVRAVRGQLGDRRGPWPADRARSADLPGLDPAPGVRHRAR